MKKLPKEHKFAIQIRTGDWLDRKSRLTPGLGSVQLKTCIVAFETTGLRLYGSACACRATSRRQRSRSEYELALPDERELANWIARTGGHYEASKAPII